jgi:hypothetical protein
MSVIKFGYRKSKEGVLGPLKFGIFKWGQPNKFYLLNSLLDYLPQFIERNSLCNAIMKSIAVVLLQWHKVVLKFSKYRLSGKPGLKNANENWKLFLKESTSDNEMAAKMGQLYDIHIARGTADGMLDDIKNVTNSDISWYKFYGEDSCGWWLDSTFPDISTDGYSNKANKLTFIELENMLFVEYYNRSNFSSAFIQNLLLKEAIPVNLNTTFLELRPFRIKFGTFKFGTRRFGEFRAPRQYLIGSDSSRSLT